jgi:hypothetical protein
MSPKQLASFRLAPEVIDGLHVVKDRDGVPLTVQVDRALRVWLKTKGVDVGASRQRGSAKKARREQL